MTIWLGDYMATYHELYAIFTPESVRFVAPPIERESG